MVRLKPDQPDWWRRPCYFLTPQRSNFPAYQLTSRESFRLAFYARPSPPSVPCAMLRAKWTINDNCLDFLDERRFCCNNLRGACVDAKPRGIEATCIVSGGRGTNCVSSYCEQQKPRRRPANEAVMILCVRVYESAAHGTVQSDSLVLSLSEFPNYLVSAPLNTVESYCLLWIPN